MFLRKLHRGFCSRRAFLQRHLEIRFHQLIATWRRADISLFHEYMPPPFGGGHQFMRALWRQMEARGYRIENNTISRTTRACLFNSFNFDFERLRCLKRPGCRMVHRVDGPVGIYRGQDDGADRRIYEINSELADATVFQSEYCLRQHRELGMTFRNPVIIRNTVDAEIFHPRNRIAFDRKRKIRLISSSWSDNSNKGAATYKWIEDHLDWERFEYTFVGRTPIRFSCIRTIPPVPSENLADLLRQHDIYITASKNDPCSNALLEALACGLPALYLNSGGHPELVQSAGFPFVSEEEIPGLLDRLVEEFEERQSRICIPSLDEVTAQYLQVMKILE